MTVMLVPPFKKKMALKVLIEVFSSEAWSNTSYVCLHTSNAFV